MQIRGKEPCAELIRRQALRGSFSARNRQQRKAVAEVTEPDAPGVQHLAAPGVGAEAKQLVIEVQGDVITALQLVTVLGSVDVFLGIVPGAEVNWRCGTTSRPLPWRLVSAVQRTC